MHFFTDRVFSTKTSTVTTTFTKTSVPKILSPPKRPQKEETSTTSFADSLYNLNKSTFGGGSKKTSPSRVSVDRTKKRSWEREESTFSMSGLGDDALYGSLLSMNTKPSSNVITEKHERKKDDDDEFSFDFLLEDQDTKASITSNKFSRRSDDRSNHLQAAGAKSFEASSAVATSSGNNNDRTDMEDYVASLLGDDFLL